MSENLFFVPHTRWDREWYKSFEVFRISLVRTIDEFIDYLENVGEFPSFTLDGQSILISDYLKIRPEMKPTIEKLAREGILLLGPWMVQPDLFAGNGEIIVRNLLEGRKESSRFAEPIDTFYIPESTGIISQVPQIMQNFGMEHLVFIRGLGDEEVSTEYKLRGSDGSEVIATYLVKAYNNAGFLPEDVTEAEERIENEVEKLKPSAATDWLLMNNGGDHHKPQVFLPRIVEELKKTGKYGEIEIGGFSDYFKKLEPDALKNLPVLKGELRGCRHYPILSGRTSARMDIKLESQRVINHLLNFVEPLSVWEFAHRGTYPRLPLSRVWQLLIENYHHSTAGGSVNDLVNNEAMLRLLDAKDILNQEWDDTIDFIISLVKDPSEEKEDEFPIIVLNTLPRRRSGSVLVYLVTPAEMGGRIKVLDEMKQEIPHQILSCSISEGTYPYPSREKLRTWELLIWADDVPAMGYSVYMVKIEKGKEESINPAPTIVNEYFEVGFEEGGTIFIRDLRTNRTFKNMHYFIDQADAGDLYNFSPLTGDIPLSHIVQDIHMEVLTTGRIQQTLQLRGNISVPASLTRDRRRRSVDREMCPFSFRVSLYSGVPYVDCSLTIENRAKDHKLSLAFPLESAVKKVRAGQPFDIVNRSMEIPDGNNWIESPPTSHPFQGILDIKCNDYSLGFYSLGPLEYELRTSKNGPEVLFTLVRSVGWLSREDCKTRKVEVGPKISTPGAQCLNKLTYHYAIVPHRGEEDYNEIIAGFQKYSNPLRGTFLPVGAKVGKSDDLFSLSPEKLVISCCKVNQEGDGIILRFYNPTDDNVSATVKGSKLITSCRKTNMMEKSWDAFKDLPFEFDVKPREIITLELSRKKGKNV